MREMEENSIDTIITDPPYNLVSISKRWSGKDVKNTPGMETEEGSVWARKAGGFMGKEWDGTGIALDQKIWAEALRVAKPGAMLLAFGGTRTFHRIAVAIEDAGWEIRDTLMWLYGSGFPKSHNIQKALEKKGEDGSAWAGFGSALKPAYEPIILAMKPVDKTFANNALKYGVAGLNIDGGG